MACPQPRQRLGIRYFLVPNARERAVDQIRPYFSLQHVVAPVPHMLQDQQPQRHFRRCLRSSTRTAIRMALPLCIVHTFDQRCVFQQLIYFFHPWFPQILDFLCQSAVPQTWLSMSKLDHAASLISSDAASTRKATLRHHPITRKFTITHYDALYLRRKVARPTVKYRIQTRRVCGSRRIGTTNEPDTILVLVAGWPIQEAYWLLSSVFLMVVRAFWRLETDRPTAIFRTIDPLGPVRPACSEPRAMIR